MPVNVETLQAGLLKTAADMYMTDRVLPDWVGSVIDLGETSDKRTESRGYFESAPVMKHQWRGDPINEGAFDSKTFDVTNFNYSMRVRWHRDDREDDQTDSLFEQAQGAGRSARTLPLRALYDMLLGQTNMLPVVYNAPDGAANFDASTRFGVSGGNIQSGVTFSTGVGVRNGIWQAIERFHNMQDTEEQELHDTGIIENGGILVLFSAADTQQFAEAFKQEISSEVISTSNAGVSNTLMASGMKFNLVNAGFRLSTGTAFIFLMGARKKAFFQQTRTPLLQSQSMSGSQGTETTQTYGDEWVQQEQRLGYGSNLPYAAIKLTT